jgi:outer membrane protein assembly factor BamB
MYSRINLKIMLVCFYLMLTCLLIGCGGGGNNNNTTSTRQGQVRLHITWPATPTTSAVASNPKTRYIPGYAASLVFELSPKGTPAQRYVLTVNRPTSLPASQDVTFSQLLPTGTYELAGAARVGQDGQGATVASGAVEIEVKVGINPVPLTLNSTVKTLLILGQPISTGVGQNLTLQSGAFDPDGAGLLLPDGALTWSLVSGSQFGSITSSGVFTAAAPGKVRVRVSEPVTGIWAEADVTISTQTTNIGLAQSGYPKSAANLASSGLVQGSGATGQLAWTFDLGNRGIGTPVLGMNNLLFALTDTGALFAIDAITGVKKWEAAVPFNGQNSLFGSLLASDDNTVYAGTYAGVAAYDSATSLKKWTNTDYHVTGNMTLISGKLYVPSAFFGMAVIDARTGKSLPPLPGISGSNSATYDGAIASGLIYYVSQKLDAPRGAALLAVNLGTGATVWTKDIPIAAGHSYVGTSPVIAPDGTIYVEFGDGNISSFDGLTGTPKFTHTALANFGILQPSIGKDGSVIIARTDSTESANKEEKYDALLNTKIWSVRQVLAESTVGADGTVYGTGSDATIQGQTTLFAFNGADGSAKWTFSLNKGPGASLGGTYGDVPGFTAVGTNGMVYVVSLDHLVYAIK